MSIGKRLVRFIIALIMIPAGIAMLIWPEQGYRIAILLTVISFFIDGIRKLWFYFTMSRFKTGGLKMLYSGLLDIDIGLFALGIQTVPKFLAMLYLIGYLLINGAINILRGNEARMQKSGHYKLQMVMGIIMVVFALLCFIDINSVRLISIILALGLFSYAVESFIEVFRRTTIIYVP